MSSDQTEYNEGIEVGKQQAQEQTLKDELEFLKRIYDFGTGGIDILGAINLKINELKEQISKSEVLRGTQNKEIK